MLWRLAVIAGIVLEAICGLASAEEGTCYLTEQLQNQQARQDYLESVKRLRKTAGRSRYPLSPERFPVMQSAVVDTFSYECLSCHDGSTAPLTRNSHPIGVDYPDRRRSGGKFMPRQSLDPRIVLIAGKIGCLSCHDPLNQTRMHLIISNDRSNLCFTCHIN